jgi:hypothetical protein
MRMYEMTLRILCVLLLAATVAHAAGPEVIDWSNPEVVIRGDYFRAASVAYADYSQHLAKRARDASAPDYKGDRELVEYLSRIEHFNIEVGFGNGSYHIRIAPRTSEQFRGIFGGGAFYLIDAKEFKIREREYSK